MQDEGAEFLPTLVPSTADPKKVGELEQEHHYKHEPLVPLFQIVLPVAAMFQYLPCVCRTTGLQSQEHRSTETFCQHRRVTDGAEHPNA